jgi:hypothetical protein
LTNEVSAGLGIRQPVNQIGGNFPFGVNRYSFLSQNLDSFQNDGAGNSGILLLTGAPLGIVDHDMIADLWNEVVDIQATGVTTPTVIYAQLLIRDSTVQSTVTLAQAIARHGVAGSDFVAQVQAINFTGPGTYISFDDFLVWEYTPQAIGPGIHDMDDYGNLIQKGDALVVDFVVAAQAPADNQTGTFDAVVWFSSLVT